MRHLGFIAVISLVFLFPTSLSHAALLSKALSLGDSGEDVRTLQTLLNNDSRTTVSFSGAGSKGNETTYFGTLTQTAVIKFQELYASDVLIPAGLTEGSGYVGSLTRKKLDELYEQFPPQETGVDISTQVFSRNLSLGDSGTDVKRLQEILNSNTRTRIALSGAGSYGNETMYFGTLTRDAVVEFQELYAKEVLLPVGLSKGTGFVGPSTRAKLNSLSISAQTEEEITTSSAPQGIAIPPTVEESAVTQIFQESSELILAYPSAYEAMRGDRVILSGTGFARENNTVHVGGTAAPNLPSASGVSIAFTVPDTVPLGKHDLYISNTKGESNKSFLVVISDSGKRPVVATSTPAEGSYGDTVTIKGANFTKEGNEIRTSYAIIPNVPSPDSETLTFQVLPETGISALQIGVHLNLGMRWNIYFYVVNDNGVSSEPGIFILKI